jgi:TPR repeat protein
MDYVQAAKWFYLAASQGNEDAKSAYSKLSEIMSPEKISQAQELAKEFVPKNANQ